MDDYGLSKIDIEKVKGVFLKHTQIQKVLIYGSRVLGNYKPASDIDLTLIGAGIDLKFQLNLAFELDDLMLPYKFDISIFDEITNPDFRDHIIRVGKEFYIQG